MDRPGLSGVHLTSPELRGRGHRDMGTTGGSSGSVSRPSRTPVRAGDVHADLVLEPGAFGEIHDALEALVASTAEVVPFLGAGELEHDVHGIAVALSVVQAEDCTVRSEARLGATDV